MNRYQTDIQLIPHRTPEPDTDLQADKVVTKCVTLIGYLAMKSACR